LIKLTKENAGIYHMIFAAFCISVAGACSKVLSKRLSPMEIVFLRNIFGVLYVLWLIYQKPFVQKGGRSGLLFFRGFLGALAILANFYTIIHIGLAEAITYQQSYPIFLSLISVYFLKKGISRNEWLTILMGFIGICFIFFPQFKINAGSIQDHSIGIFYSVIAAIAYLSIAELSKFYEQKAIVLVFMSVGVFMPAFLMIIGYIFHLNHPSFLFSPPLLPIGIEWIIISVLGLTALLGQIHLTKAFSIGQASAVSAVGYSQIVFSLFLGILIGDAFPNNWSFLGILLIIISGIVIAFNKKNI
jgi:drug/metabolite transporter (DMT)-like permease